jgi:ketoreductase RED2
MNENDVRISGLDGKVVVVTGSSSGIGEATARLASASGAKVLVNSSSSVEAGQALAASLPGARYVQGNVAEEAGATAIAAAAMEHFGGIDVLINNAGTTVVIPHNDLEAVTLDVWHRILDVNVIGTWLVTMACLPALRASGDGSIVNVTSLAGLRPVGSSIPYSVSKAALNQMTELLAKQVGPQVRVNAIAPGLIETPWTSDWDAQHAGVRLLAPLKRSGTAFDCAHAILSAAVSPYMSGAIIAVDGGSRLVM